MESAQQTVLQGDICVKILRFCDWLSRAHVAALNRQVRSTFAQDAHWQWMCRRLVDESLLFCPETLCAPTWRHLFLELFPLRTLFEREPARACEDGQLSPSKALLQMVDQHVGSEVLTEEEEALQRRLLEQRLKIDAAKKPQTFDVKVVARMKPQDIHEATSKSNLGTSNPDSEHAGADLGVSVVLPLHQRLQLIRSERKCSLREARRILWKHRFPSACAADPWADADVKTLPSRKADENTPSNQRPHSLPEASAEADLANDEDKVQACVVAVSAGAPGAVLMCCPGTGLREFTFDAVLGGQAPQEHVYDVAPRRMVVDFINGRNASIFAFGQTGSGKTHTMFGPTVESGAQVLMVEAEGVGSAGGIVPRACSDVLQALQVRRARGVMATLRISYVEIYGENVTDLLNENATVGQWQGVAHRAVFGGLVGVEVKDAQHLQELLLRGDSAKRRAATAMNQRSSRAHCLLMLSLTQVRADTAAEVESFLAMADLGGSEQVLKSQVASLSVQAGGFLQADTRLKEAVNINLGLLALKTCIRHLVDRSPYVPYQNSRLTMMMSKCLDSDCRTAVVVTGSSERRNALETMLTLRFGEECSQVVQTQGSSMTAAARGIKALDVEIANLEETIQRKERWETVVIQREDGLHQQDEATQATETIKVSKLVGAETERVQLELLLARRRILTGL